MRKAILVWCVLVACSSLASGIEKADRWVIVNDPPPPTLPFTTQWWFSRNQQCGTTPPFDPHCVQTHTFSAYVAPVDYPVPDPGDALDLEYTDLLANSAYFDITGPLGMVSGDYDFTSDSGSLIQTQFFDVRATLIEPVSTVDNGGNVGGVIDVDLAGHRVLIDSGSYSYTEYDSSGALIADGLVDFASSPAMLEIAWGDATFDASLDGPLHMQFHTGMTPSYFAPAEEVMLTFDFDLTANAVPEPSGLGWPAIASTGLLACCRRRRV